MSKKFTDNNKRKERIQRKMVAEHGKPIIVFGYFSSQAEACEKLQCTNAMLNKGIKRNGTTRGMNVIKGYSIDKALTLLIQLHELANNQK